MYLKFWQLQLFYGGIGFPTWLVENESCQAQPKFTHSGLLLYVVSNTLNASKVHLQVSQKQPTSHG